MKGYKIYCDCEMCRDSGLFKRHLEIRKSIREPDKLIIIIKGLLFKGNVCLTRNNIDHLIEILNKFKELK